MPTVIKGPQLPSWADPQEATVLDPLYKTLVRKAVSALGLDDPAGSVMGAATPTVTPLVSIFKDKAARAVSTGHFLEKIKNFAERNNNPNILKAGEDFAKRFPRVAAHMRLAPEAWPNSSYATMRTASPVKAPMTMEISALGNNASKVDPGKAAEFMFHEGTHAAQALGNKNFSDLYELSGTFKPYRQIPFEETAFQRGEHEGAKAIYADRDVRRATAKLPPLHEVAPEHDLKPFKDTRLKMTNPSPEVQKWRKIVERGSNAPAEHRMLNKSILENVTKEAGMVPYTATRGLEEIANTNPLVTPGPLHRLRQILEERAKTPIKP